MFPSPASCFSPKKSIIFSILLFFISIFSFAQQKLVSGNVVTEKSAPMEGVSITIKGTQTGTVTNAQGNFTLNVDDDNAVLVVSNLGFTTQEVPVVRSRPMKIVLVGSYSSLNDVVVVGYNTQRRGDLTGSVASVKGKDLENLPASSLATALQGRVPGAYISQTDGNPNSNAAILIRGPLSINGGDPLVIVDGVPFQ